MARLAPDGDTYQAGTLSGNPVAMAAGVATLDLLERESGLAAAGERAARELERLLAPVLERGAVSRSTWCAPGRCSGCRCTRPARRAPPRRSRSRKPRASRRCSTPCSTRGVYLPPSAYEACFLSLAHSSADLAALRPGAARVARHRRLRSMSMKAHPRLPAHRARAGAWCPRCRWAGGSSTSTSTRSRGCRLARRAYAEQTAAAQALLDAGTTRRACARAAAEDRGHRGPRGARSRRSRQRSSPRRAAAPQYAWEGASSCWRWACASR